MGTKFKLTVWTDFGIPSSREFQTREAAAAYGEMCIRELGCSRFKIVEVA